jgi:hypothetical protein
MTSRDPEKELSSSPPESISPVASSPHLDENYELYKSGRDLQANAEEEKRVLRKIDFRIIPILFVTYMLQYLDKNSINFSSVYGLQKGTNLKGQDYSWLGLCTPIHTELASANQIPKAQSSTLATSSPNSQQAISSSACPSAGFSLYVPSPGESSLSLHQHVLPLLASPPTASS